MVPFFAGFGLMNMDKEEVMYIQHKINVFNNTTDKDAIFVLFIGATSHWVALVIHKEKSSQIQKFYLLDSSNLLYLNCEEDDVPALFDEELHQNVALGFPRKKYDTFTTKMVLHTLIDLRKTFEIIIDVFKQKEDNSLVKYYNKWFLHNKLKHFWNYT